MSKKRLQRALVALTLALGVITLDVAPANAIYDGDSISSAPPWAAYVTVNTTVFGKNIAPESNCTGTVVSDRWVLTAAHCVVTKDSEGNPTTTTVDMGKVRVVLGRDDLGKTHQGGQWTITDIKLSPAWQPSTLSGDAALLQLSGALPSAALPMPLAPGGFSIPDEESATAYGYGHVSEKYDTSGTLKSGKDSDVLRSTKSGSYVVDLDCTLSTKWCMRRTGASQVLHGDSGGPWVLSPENPFIIGVSSSLAGFQAGPKQTGFFTYAAATRTTEQSLHTWITNTAGIVEGNPGVIYRNPDTAQAWLLGPDGFRHSIPDGGTYLCLTAKGHQVINLTTFLLAELPLSTTDATCTTGTNLVVNGDFEADTFAYSGSLGLGTGSPLTGWTTNSNGTYPWGLPNINSYNAGPTPNHDQWVIVGNFYLGGTWIQQTLTGLTVGDTYTLSLATASEERNGGGQALLEVSFPSGSSTPAQTVNAPATLSNLWDTWTTSAINFEATSTSVTIRFLGLAGPGGDPGIDDVTVST